MKQCVLGIDLGGTNIKAGIVSLEGKVIERWRQLTNAHEGGPAVLKRMLKFAEEILNSEKIKSGEYVVEAIGIGSPGAIDHINGVVSTNTANIPDWGGIKIVESFQKKFNLPTSVDNDANLFALAEAKFGAGQGSKVVLCYTMGTGIGGGLIIDGKVFHGVNNYAGELGHTIVEVDGAPCTCGGHGCVEAYTAAAGITRYAKQLMEKNPDSNLHKCEKITPRTVYETALEGDKTALQVIKRTGKYLGTAISSMVAAINPDKVIIGGGISAMGEILLDHIKEEVKSRVFFYRFSPVEIVPAGLGGDAGTIGAAAQAMETE